MKFFVARVGPSALRPLAAALLCAAATITLRAHGTEARRVVELQWTRDHITRTLGANRSELGLNGSKAPDDMMTIDGRSCIFGDLFVFDVDDKYAFDIDEDVDVTVTYAPDRTQPFTVGWDRNGGDGYGVSKEVAPERGAALRTATVRLDRARFAGLGLLKTDLAVGARGGIALCDLAIARSGTTKPAAAAGRLQLELLDADTRDLVPARIGLYDTTGRAPLPSDQALLVHRYADETRLIWVAPRLLWPSANRQAFYAIGRYEAQVPAGSYELVVTRGPEYRTVKQTVEVKAGDTSRLTVALQRYINQPSRGWYSGDTHLHLMRDQVQDPAVWGMVAGEDVHVGNLLEMGNIVTTHFRQPAWGKAGRYWRDGHLIASGQEDPRTTERGHTIHHNLQHPIHLPSSDFFSYHKVFEQSHSQGGVSGYAHMAQIFNGRRGLSLDAPFNLVDFIEVLQGGRLGVDNWYPYLNLGFKISPAAGSDYPYFGPSLPGVERYYVKLDGPFDADAWYASFRAGHVFVTNGPLLDFTINGKTMGDEIHVARGARLQVAASMQLNPDIDAPGALDLIVHGDVVDTAHATGGDRITLRKELTADHSMWIAVRATGARQVPAQGQVQTLGAVAHSAPIYVVVDEQPFWKTAAVADLVRTEHQILQDLLTAPVDPMGDLEAWETVGVLAPQWERQKYLLRPRVEQANAKYDDILRRATGARSSSARARIEGLGLAVAAAIGLVAIRGRRARPRR
ncbi:MAG TPA: CehA/McbA family metallohydrolase [Vicinamibacterales bacterium]|nr:CehA/McbA family metallohydrolase [Vicinamibacterales bacterium]